MNNLVNFILESGISLSLLAVIYILFLRKETFFRLNRLFLLFSIVFSVVLPFLKFRVYAPKTVMLEEVTVTPYRNLIEAVTVYGQDLSGAFIQSVGSSKILISVYLLGLLVFLSLFLFRLIQILRLIKANPVHKVGMVKFVSLEDKCSPFSFLNYIFVTRGNKQDEDYEKIVAHEMEHIKQGHTFDVLILEILTVFQWFNPFLWMLKHVIRENHEYLADHAVLNSGISSGEYKKLLLSQALGFQMELVNNFNSSLVKKRIKMISKIRSSRLANLKYIFGIVSLVALLVAFACEQKESLELERSIEETKKQLLLKLEGDKIRLEGEEEDIIRVQAILSKGGSRMFFVDSLGNTYLSSSDLPNSKLLGEDEKIFNVVENMPVFPGGEQALKKYITNIVNYPELAVEKEIQGRVYVNFVVTKSGGIANVRIARGVDPVLDKEAMRVISSLPKWKPGYQRGEPVHVSYTVPISFVLD